MVSKVTIIFFHWNVIYISTYIYVHIEMGCILKYSHHTKMNDKLAKVTWYIIDKPEDANVFLSWINILTFDVHGHWMCVMFGLEGPNIKLLTHRIFEI